MSIKYYFCIIHTFIFRLCYIKYGIYIFILVLTIIITEWRTKFLRRMNLADNNMESLSVDSMLNFETVKYYSAEDYEVKIYKDAVTDYQVILIDFNYH